MNSGNLDDLEYEAVQGVVQETIGRQHPCIISSGEGSNQIERRDVLTDRLCTSYFKAWVVDITFTI